jgi:hypothetical protein
LANVAVLIGNTDYKLLNKLECCSADVEAMQGLLAATGRFDNIEVILNSDSAHLKERVRTVIDAHKSISEIFFYYTGHGFMRGPEFYYCATDFDDKRPNETGIANSELHVLLRSLEADLVVKVIDACSSGALLIKSDGAFLPVDKGAFKNILQIASCLDSQSSLTGDPLSLFTEKFRGAALRKTEGVVYYTDIISALRDDFLENNDQTPHFVSQMTGREQFVDNAAKLSALRSTLAAPLAVGTATTETNIAQPVVNDFEVLTRAEGKFAQKELAQDFIAKLFEKISQETSTDEFFGQLFTSEAIIHSDFKEPTARDFIIRVLSGEKRPDEFVTVSAPKPRTPWGLASLAATSLSSILSEDPFRDYQLRLNCHIDKVQLKITYTPKFVSLKRFVLVVTCAPSLERCYVMELLTQHSLTDWGFFDSEGTEVIRRWYRMPWTDTCEGLVAKICVKFKEIVKERIDATVKALAE